LLGTRAKLQVISGIGRADCDAGHPISEHFAAVADHAFIS
jgi:hypothetical protein